MARRRLFVGRDSELELFRQALLADELPFAVLHIFGPGGVGKTTLLHEYARCGAERGLPVTWLDGSNVDPSPEGLLFAFGEAARAGEPPVTLEALADLTPGVLLLDTYERLAPLDSWLRESFLPHLPAHVLVVIAGRNPPPSAWRTDPAWRDLARILSLRNLRPEDSRSLLTALGVSETLQEAVLSVTYGHPLALSLMADWLALGASTEPFALERAPDAVRLLVERFVQDIPSPRHRQALEIGAHARVTTEALLAEVMGAEEARELFSWLRGLSFVEHVAEGLLPHDLVRDVLEADLRWRDPDGYRQMHRRVRQYLVRRTMEQTGAAHQRSFFDLLFLHRHQQLMKPYYDWKALGSAYAEPAAPRDHSHVLQMVERHEGKEAARIAAYWLERQPQAFQVFRASDLQTLGFAAHLVLQEPAPEDKRMDPAIRAAWAYVRRYGPLRPGEQILYHRFWMGSETYQEPLIQNLVAATAYKLWLGTPSLAWTFPCGADPDYWEPMFAYLNFHRAPEADFQVGDRRYGVFAHDWRAEPILAWLEITGERELAQDLTPEQLGSAATSPLMVLSQPEFAAAVRQALRDYTRPGALAANPLLRSRLLVERADPEDGPEGLQALLLEAAETLRSNPKDEKLYRVLRHTYLQPLPTQEAAAELLDLPFSTYRYQLGKGLARVTDWLWQRELYGPEG